MKLLISRLELMIKLYIYKMTKLWDVIEEDTEVVLLSIYILKIMTELLTTESEGVLRRSKWRVLSLIWFHHRKNSTQVEKCQ